MKRSSVARNQTKHDGEEGGVPQASTSNPAELAGSLVISERETRRGGGGEQKRAQALIVQLS